MIQGSSSNWADDSFGKGIHWCGTSSYGFFDFTKLNGNSAGVKPHWTSLLKSANRKWNIFQYRQCLIWNIFYISRKSHTTGGLAFGVEFGKVSVFGISWMTSLAGHSSSSIYGETGAIHFFVTDLKSRKCGLSYQPGIRSYNRVV